AQCFQRRLSDPHGAQDRSRETPSRRQSAHRRGETNMSIDANDPRLTAYALDELDESEKAAIEAELAQSPEARAAVKNAREMATMLSDGLRAETAPQLSDAQRVLLKRSWERPPFR